MWVDALTDFRNHKMLADSQWLVTHVLVASGQIVDDDSVNNSAAHVDLSALEGC
jgi:hypothetical protein